MNFRGPILSVISFAILIVPVHLYAQNEIISRHTKIYYHNENDLKLFNKRLKLGSLDYLLRHSPSNDSSTSKEVAEKVDIILERVRIILEIYPKNFKVEIRVLENPSEVQRVYFDKYSKKVDFIAFYSRGDKTIYLAVDKIRSNILAHELSHALIDHYFGAISPVKIHEILAQYVDANFED
jgi:RNase P/RNase MRP subunit p30